MKEMEEIKSILDEFYFRRPDDYGLKREGENVFKSYIDLVARYTEKGGRVLDLGAGAGYALKEISKKGFEVVGCDLYSADNPEYYSKLASDANPGFVSYDGINLPFKSESFDTVSSLCLFEHVILVDNLLREVHRVVKKNGIVIINSPNWSGLNIPLRAIQSIVFKKDRYWQYEHIGDAILGIFRSFFWYFKIIFAQEINEMFIIVYPRLRDRKVDFGRSDDDCVHLCHPLSFKKWFKKYNYNILEYNRFRGDTFIAKLFNSLFPSFATTNTLVVKKC